MRSSVVEPHPSRDVKTRAMSYESRPDTRIPDPQPRVVQPPGQKAKRQLVLVPADGWFSMLLLLIAVSCVIYSMNSMPWIYQSSILYFSSAAGLVVGFVVAKIRHFPQSILHLAACLVGHWLSIWLTSVIAFHVSWLLLLENVRAVIMSGLATGGIPHSSEMVFLFYLAFLCFFLGYFGAWLIYRARLPWLVAFVYCAILLVTLNSGGQDSPLLIVILLGVLILLIARVQLAAQIVKWKNEGLHTDRSWLRSISWRFMQITFVFALIALLLSWLLPMQGEPVAGVTFWDSVDNAWSNISHGQFSLQDPGALAQPYQAPANFFGDQLAITGSVNLPDGEVLYYTSTAQPHGQYLEGFSYDHFDGHTWISTINDRQNIQANATLPMDIQGSSTPVTTSITIQQPPAGPKHFIFAPAQPSTFDVDTTVYGIGNAIPSAWAKQTPFSSGEHYQVQSLLLSATPQNLSTVPFSQNIQDLWQIDGNYPLLQNYYFQVPTLSPLVQATAQQWTAGAIDAYRAMNMLEQRLGDQTVFTYSVTNQPVPANVDAVTWLLETHRGYCTYYATAMVMMARLLGMPARIVNGFSPGHYQAQRKVWVVNGADAHSWVQVYFPTFGWVNFDPTPGYSANTATPPPPSPSPTSTPRPSHPTPTPTPKGKTQPPGSQPPADIHTPGTIANSNLLVGLSLGTLCCSILLLLLSILTYWWRNLFANASFVTGMYWRVCRLASWVGLPPQSWQTPYEYSRMLGRYFPQDMAPLRRLTELFVRDRWAAPHEMPFTAEEDDLERLWPHFRRMFLHIFLLRMRKRQP
jgi:transglutaminase-like putative cysteine protease